MKRYLSLCIAAAVLSGCSGNIKKTDQDFDKNTASADKLASVLKKEHPIPDDDPVQVFDGEAQYVDTRPIRVSRYEQLDTLTRCNVTFSPASGVTLLEVGQFVSKTCGLPVRVAPDALLPPHQTGPGADAALPTMADTASTIPLPPGVSLPTGQGGYGSGGVSTDRLDIRYERGPLPGFLDAAAARFGIAWRVENGGLVIFRNETRVFYIYNMPSALQLSNAYTSGTTTTAGATQAGGSSGGGASGGGMSNQSGSTQTANVALKTDPAADILKSIKAMTTHGNAHYAPSNGTVVVTDTPDVLDKVQSYVNDLNINYSKQVLLNFRVLAVVLSSAESYGISWDAVYRNVAKNYNIGLTGKFKPQDGSVEGAVNILENSKHWSGAEAMFNALSTQGKVYTVTDISVIARNWKQSPIQLAHQESFLASVATTISGTGGIAQTQATPGTVITGTNSWALPIVYGDNKTLEVSMSINFADLVKIVKEHVGDATMGLPVVESKMLSPDVTLKSGETAVIASYLQEIGRNDRSGTGSASNYLFGGGINNHRQRVQLVMLVTPTILRHRVPPASFTEAAP